MTPAEIAAIRARADAAIGLRSFDDPMYIPDTLRSDVLALCDALDAAQREVERLWGFIRAAVSTDWCDDAPNGLWDYAIEKGILVQRRRRDGATEYFFANEPDEGTGD